MKNMLNTMRRTLAKVISPTKNSMSLPQQFMKYGSKGMKADWTDVMMSDQDLYTGYGYASIRNRSNLVARIALEYATTDSGKADFIHPYLDLISKSKSFPDYKFWADISTYLDLEGVYYLMAVRAVGISDDGLSKRVGAIKEFKLLNPYNVRRIMDTTNPSMVKGYIETRNGLIREIPAEMIIEMRELNPFDDNIPFAMTDASKESQFTLKTSGDYTRHSLRNNFNAPGIISTDVVLEEEEFKRFMDRVKAHTKGEPIFGNGQGAITWENMQIELSKAALKDINEINRESLFAVSGVSKTIMGIEQSGVTRETSKVQKDLIIENHILPRIQLIIDSLNQDYENNYDNEYRSNSASIIVINPVGSDHDSEIKELDAKTKKYELFSKLINRRVDPIMAEQFINGEKNLSDLNMEIIETPVFTDTKEEDKPSNKKDKDKESDSEENRVLIKNQSEATKPSLIDEQEGSLRNTIQNIEGELVGGMLTKLHDNNGKIKNESTLISKTTKKDFIDELKNTLFMFYGIVAMFKGNEIARSRSKDNLLPATFILTEEIKSILKDMAEKAATSHINTVVGDVYNLAKESALKGDSLIQIENMIKEKFSRDISGTRAATIARTETNRAFTIAQYEADKQFIEQNGLETMAYKQWHTRSSSPCDYCKALEAEGPIPFSTNFRSIGDNIVTSAGILKIEYDHLKAGNAHPNCACDYELIIRHDDDSMKKNTVEALKRAKQLLESSLNNEKIINERIVELDNKEKELNILADELERLI